METILDLRPGVDWFTLWQLFQKAAKHKGLKLPAQSTVCQPIKSYELNDDLLKILAKRNIRRQVRPDVNHPMLTLVDENSQQPCSGFLPSNYWNFKWDDKKKKLCLEIKLYIELIFDERQRAVVLLPKTMASLLSPIDHWPNFRMFQALVEADEKPPAIAKEIADTKTGQLLVTFTDLGLGGIRSLLDLFLLEFAYKNKTVVDLAQAYPVFDPHPLHRYREQTGRVLIAEPAQPKIFQAWETQLKELRRKLSF